MTSYEAETFLLKMPAFTIFPGTGDASKMNPNYDLLNFFKLDA